MSKQQKLIRRVYPIYMLLILFGLGILFKIGQVQFIEGDHWQELAKSYSTKHRKIDAIRGNIYASDGSLIATSVPKYEVRFDLNAEAITKELFAKNIDTLCFELSKLLPDKAQHQWKAELTQARKNGARYHLIRRKLSYTQIKKMRKFPLFNRGKYKGGFISIQQNKREKPFQVLASRTIGYSRDNSKPVGLEGAYNKILSGTQGLQLMQKIAGGIWMPIEDENEIEPEDGSDIITTIDINIQDVAENALLEQLTKQDADHGCVVLMEVATGEIKAIANLNKTKSGNYWETYNYAVGESTEPGSTFKLASLIAALEDGYIDLTDSVETGNGMYKFYDRKMYDSRIGGYGKITIKRAFEVSSNIAVARTISENYRNNPQKFIDRLYKMNLHQKLGIEIYGEGEPRIKSANDPTWSGISLPWISHGYEVSLTPLQILTFYNAVANDGKMVRPRFVKEIRKVGKPIKTFGPEVINPAICSKSTIEKAKAMLEGVVQQGTAMNLKNANFKIAGKTGTAQIYKVKTGYKTDVSYQASFVGYFPAKNPMYSCIVVVNAPSKNVYYGNLVAGPIFKEIANKVYATSIQLHEEIQNTAQLAERIPIPVSKNGNQYDLNNVYSELNVPSSQNGENATWVAASTGRDKVTLYKRVFKAGIIPNFIGMDLKDAIYIIENMGLKADFTGKGTIKEQTPNAGTKVENIDRVKLILT
jgi:cell division protein FtsI (penicillin-binding protein 3)